MQTAYALEMQNITKEYHGNRVLKSVHLSVRVGEIHALVGENGAGKSTLMNILFGMPVIHSTGGYSGEVYLEGKQVTIRSPQEAMAAGIGMVHQEFMLINGFTVTENIKLNREITRDNLASRLFRAEELQTLDAGAMGRDARKALDTLKMGIDEWAPVAGLPVGHLQFVEIAREIDKRGIRLLVFDEPTAVLTESEADQLIDTMKKLASTGIAILFITHRLDEVVRVAEEITVLRDGEVVATRKRQQTSVAELAELMVGRKIVVAGRSGEVTAPRAGGTILEIRSLRVDMPGEAVRGVDLEVGRGEILGIGGLAGQGKVGIANGIMGLYPSSGEVYLNGKPLRLNDTKNALKRGLAFLSEDRAGVGLLLDWSLEQNIALTAMDIKGKFVRRFGPLQVVDGKTVREHALEMIKDLDIRCRDPQQLVRQLSGGNQQKVCVARALSLEPEVLIVSEPTRGIDVGAKRLVLDLLLRLNRELGMTIIMVSSELVELRSICDRIAIIYGGKVEAILTPDASDREFGLTMAGARSKKLIGEAG